MVSYHPVMFGVHWSSASEDMTYLICPVTSKDHLIEGSSNVIGTSSSSYVSTLPGLVAIGTVEVEI